MRRQSAPLAAIALAPACALGVLLCAGGCAGRKAARSPVVPVSVARVEERTVPDEIEASGTVEPQQTVAVNAQVGGILEQVTFNEGDAVRAGQVLFQLDPRPFRAAFDQAHAVLARDRAQADNARRAAERAATLREQNLISVGEFDDARASADALAAAVRADSAAAAAAELNLQYATIRAPISGRTGNLFAHAGNLIKAVDTDHPLVTINLLRPVRVRFTVPESSLPAVLRSRREALRVLASPADRDSFALEGRLVFVDNAVDAATGTLLLKGEFANLDESLWPGEFVRVRLELARDPHAIVVPAAAVTAGPSGPFVYVLEADSTVTARPVEVARTAGSWSVIARGVQPSEIVVTDGQVRLAPGSHVGVRPGLAALPLGVPAASADPVKP